MSYEVSERRACQALGFPRSSQRYQSIRRDRAELRIRLRDLAAVRVRYGYRRLHLLLRREGYLVNAKLIYRLYCEEGLTMRSKRPRRHRSGQVRQDRQPAQGLNDRWSMDFIAEQLSNGQRLRILTLVDNFSRESLAVQAGRRFTGDQVVRRSSRSRSAQDHPGRQWPGVYLEIVGPLGLEPGRAARL